LLNRADRFLAWLLCLACLVGSGCHTAAAPIALKAAKYRKAILLHRVYRTRAVTVLEKQYDANHNGIIDPQEAMVLRQQLMYEKSLREYRRMDIDGNGIVDVDEYESFHPPR